MGCYRFSPPFPGLSVRPLAADNVGAKLRRDQRGIALLSMSRFFISTTAGGRRGRGQEDAERAFPRSVPAVLLPLDGTRTKMLIARRTGLASLSDGPAPHQVSLVCRGAPHSWPSDGLAFFLARGSGGLLPRSTFPRMAVPSDFLFSPCRSERIPLAILAKNSIRPAIPAADPLFGPQSVRFDRPPHLLIAIEARNVAAPKFRRGRPQWRPSAPS